MTPLSQPGARNGSHQVNWLERRRITYWGCCLLAAAVLGATAPREAVAQTTWTGTGANTNWSTASNWLSNPPTNNSSRAYVFTGFNGLSNTNDLTSGTATSITFNSSGFTLVGNALTLGGNITNSITTGTNTIGLNINLGGSSRTITGSGGGRLVLGGNLSNGALSFARVAGSGTATYVLSGSNTVSGTTFVNGAATVILQNRGALGSSVLRLRVSSFDVVGGPYDFTNNLELDGAGGTINFLGSSDASFTGTTSVVNTSGLTLNVNASTLTLATLRASGAGTSTFAKSGAGTLIIAEAAQEGYVSPISVTAGTLEVRHAGALGSGTLTLGGGTFQTNGDLTIANPIAGGAGVLGGVNNFTLSGRIVGSGALNKAGNNTVTLSATNSYSGITGIAAGVLLLDTNAALPGGIGFTGGLSNLALGLVGQQNDGVIGLKSGTFARAPGTQFASVNMQYGGGFAAYGSGVAVNLGGSSASREWGASNFLNDASAILVLGANDATHTVDFQNPLVTGTLAGDARTIKVNNGSAAVDAVMSGVISSSAGAPKGITKTGLGTLALTAANTFGGVLTVAEGAVEVATINNASAAGPLGNSANAVVLGSAGNIGSLSYTGGSASSSKAFTAATGGTAGFVINNAATTLTLSGLIDGDGDKSFGGAGSYVIGGGLGGTGTVFKTGSGALTLSQAGHAGGYQIQAGRLNLNADSAIGNATSLALGGGIELDNASGGAVRINNSGVAISLGSSLDFIGTKDLNMGGGTVTLGASSAIDVQAGTLTFEGNVVDGSSRYGITKNGPGTLVFSGLAGGAFSGNSVLNDGELFLDGLSTLGGGTGTTITLNPGTTLRVGATASTGNTTIDYKGGSLILLSGSVQNSGQTFLVNETLSAQNALFNGVQTIGAGVTVSGTSDQLGTTPATPTAGRIVMENGAVLRSTQAINIAANKGIELAGASATFNAATGSIFINSQVTGTGALVKTGTGGFRILNQSNSYAGGTEILEGTFGIYGDGSLGQAGTRVLIDGAILNSGQGTSGQTVTVSSARSIVLGNGKTSNLDATNGSTLAYAGVITELDAGGTAANLQIGSHGFRAGTVLLGGANTYRGDTIIDAGTLKLGSGGSFANSPRIIVGGFGSSGVGLDITDKTSFSIGSNQTLQGIGTVVLGPTTAMTVSGLFSPGNSPGLFTYSGGSTTLTGTTLLEIWGTGRGTGYDAVNVIDSGLLTLGGELVLDFNQNFSDTDTFLLFDTLTGGSLASGFSGITITGSNNDYMGLTFVQEGSVWTTGFNGNNQSLRVTQTASSVTLDIIVVPEPGTLGIAGIGIAVASWSAWKRRRTARAAAGC